jgi:hypothetical protein
MLCRIPPQRLERRGPDGWLRGQLSSIERFMRTTPWRRLRAAALGARWPSSSGFGGALNLTVHIHALVLDGVFVHCGA